MKTSFLAACTLAAITLTADYGRAQPWYYDFGTSTGSFSTRPLISGRTETCSAGAIHRLNSTEENRG